jgi:hypothetical protein
MAYCENCGTQLSDTAKFCSSCGKAVGSGVASPPTVPSKRSDPATKLILGAVAVRPDEQVDKHRSGAPAESLNSNGTSSGHVFHVT